MLSYDILSDLGNTVCNGENILMMFIEGISSVSCSSSTPAVVICSPSTSVTMREHPTDYILVTSVVIKHQAKKVSINTRGQFMKELSTHVENATTRQHQRAISLDTRGQSMKALHTHVKNVDIRLQRWVV